jgi:hypothetical protein
MGPLLTNLSAPSLLSSSIDCTSVGARVCVTDDYTLSWLSGSQGRADALQREKVIHQSSSLPPSLLRVDW